jgi:hypothetical protein
MGTRADFYIGRGEYAHWLGSIAWDGYPSGIDESVLTATSEDEFFGALYQFMKDRPDRTWAYRGWPWPWEDSSTTDYAYAFDGGKVWASCFGHEWFLASEGEKESEDDDETPSGKTAVFPQMKTDNHAPAGTKRAGNLVFGV